MNDMLIGVREKVIRANKHFHDFQSEAALYVITEMFGIRRQFEEHIPEKSGRSGITWRADLNPPPPPNLAVIAGDCLHNLRSALDHLAWALVKISAGTPNYRTHFPIWVDRLTEKHEVRDISISPGVSKNVETLLEALQPYRRVDDPTLHPLSRLARLSNIDKHRTLNLVAVDLGRVVIRFINQDRVGYAAGSSLIDGALIYWVLAEHPSYDPDVSVEHEYSPSVAFRDLSGISGKKPIPADEFLLDLLQFVRDSVVQRFARDCFGGELDFPKR